MSTGSPYSATPGMQPPPPASNNTMKVVLIILGVLFVFFLLCGGVMVALLLPAVNAARQAALRMEFADEAQIKKTVVKSYVKQGIAAEKAGLKVDYKAKHELELPEELEEIFRQDRKLANAFHALTPGRQRGYVMHISSAKQSSTRVNRIMKCVPRIMAGKGMNER